MKKLIILTVIILFLFSGATFSQKTDVGDLNQKIDFIVKKSIDKNRIPGVAVAVVKEGKIIYKNGFEKSAGFNNKKITAKTPFYIGSISKSFTALAIMQLLEEGKIKLDDPVTKYIPFFKVDKGSFSGEITVRHLLNHRSGMTEREYLSNLPGEMSIEEGVRDLIGIKLSYEPGEKYNYFNPNYNILGLIVEKVTGLSYEDYIRGKILIPLEMNNTFLSQEVIEGEVVGGHGAFFSFPVKRKEDFKKYALPSGYIVSTASDMANYLLFQLSGEFKGRKILSKENIKTMQTPANNEDYGYGMGWKIGEKFGYRIIEHGGSLYNYSANVVMIPEERIGVVLLINQNHFIYSIISNNQLMDNILRVLLNPEIKNDELNVIPLGSIFLALAVIAIFTIIKGIYQLLNLKKWKRKMKYRNKFRIFFNIALDFLIPLFLVIGIPLIFLLVFQRGFAFWPAFILMPGLVSWVIVCSIISIARGICKILFIT